MKISHSRKIEDKITDLIEEETGNFVLQIMLSDLFDEPVLPGDIIRKIMQLTDERCGKVTDIFSDLIRRNFIADKVISYYFFSAMEEKNLCFRNDDEEAVILDELICHSHYFKKEDIENNPYYRNIHLEKCSAGDFDIGSEKYLPYEIFCCKEPVQYGKFGTICIPSLAFFDSRFRYPVIKENGCAWMSITPNEIYTMKEPLSHAGGRVLVLGLGLGYFAYMAANKSLVKSVTIIEKEHSVIDLFQDNILPQFGTAAEKTTVVEADAFKYAETIEDGEYDYCFADIWHGAMDFDIYMKCREALRRFQKMRTDYWINDSFLGSLQYYCVQSIIDSFYGNDKEPPAEWQMLTGQMLKPKSHVRKKEYTDALLSDVEIKNTYEIANILDFKFMDEKIKTTDIIY